MRTRNAVSTHEDDETEHGDREHHERARKRCRLADEREAHEPRRHDREENRDAGQHLVLGGRVRGEEAPALGGEQLGTNGWRRTGFIAHVRPGLGHPLSVLHKPSAQ